MPTISAVIACRNAAPHLGQCLSSLEGHFDEVLFLDDGSTDNSEAIARAFPFVRVLTSRGYQGLAAAKAELVAATVGEFVAIVDADDYLMPDPRLAERYKPLEDSGAVLSLATVEKLGGGLIRPFGNLWTIALRQRCQPGGLLWRGDALRQIIKSVILKPYMFELQVIILLLQSHLAECRRAGTTANGLDLAEHIGGAPVAVYRADWSDAQASKHSHGTRLELLREVWGMIPQRVENDSMLFFYEQMLQRLEPKRVA